ncbi:unnamed protein product, partial [Didymodactylos carnosus]
MTIALNFQVAGSQGYSQVYRRNTETGRVGSDCLGSGSGQCKKYWFGSGRVRVKVKNIGSGRVGFGL